MKNNQENSADNQIIDTSKDAKIDVRVTTAMKNRIVSYTKKKGIKVSQFFINLVEECFAEEAKQDRLNMEADKQQELIYREEYAKYYKKKKHQKGDFSVDEPTSKNKNNGDDKAIFNFLIMVIIGIFAWLGFSYFKGISERKKTEKLAQQWQYQQNFQNTKSDLNQSDKPSDKSSPTT